MTDLDWMLLEQARGDIVQRLAKHGVQGGFVSASTPTAEVRVWLATATGVERDCPSVTGSWRSATPWHLSATPRRSCTTSGPPCSPRSQLTAAGN